jgi:hypothetical protein
MTWTMGAHRERKERGRRGAWKERGGCWLEGRGLEGAMGRRKGVSWNLHDEGQLKPARREIGTRKEKRKQKEKEKQ